MDFTKQDARGAAEQAQFCQLRDPQSGDYITDDGKPVGVMVLGSMSRTVQAGLKSDAREKLQSAKGKSKDEEVRALEDIQADLVQSAAKLTVGFQNIQRGDLDAIAPDDCTWFFDLNMFSTSSLLQPKEGEFQGQSFAQQALAFANDAGNYLGNA